jgi:hypothetical protein
MTNENETVSPHRELPFVLSMAIVWALPTALFGLLAFIASHWRCII